MITAFKFCARAIFSLLEKTPPPPWFTKFEFEKCFSLFYIISTQRSYIYKKPDTDRCFAKLRAISSLFRFFLYTLHRSETTRYKQAKTKFSLSKRFVLLSLICSLGIDFEILSSGFEGTKQM